MDFSRRKLLTILGSTPLLSLPELSLAAPQKRVLRIAYFTDTHLPATDFINDRAQKAFKRAGNCDLILFGGDNVMAVDHKSEEQIVAQYKNWRQFTKTMVKKPWRTILGNHDIEMWSDKDLTPMNGKKRPLEFYGMKNRYWVEKFGNWRIIGLDTVQRARDTYFGYIDKEQMTWLKGLLNDRKTPTLVCGHMPLLSVTALADTTVKARPFSMPVSFSTEVSNARDVIKMFRQAGNVKLCLSGHTHMVDRCDFAGTSYICGGAVCGAWWNGAHQGFEPSYTEVDLHTNGTFDVKTIVW